MRICVNTRALALGGKSQDRACLRGFDDFNAPFVAEFIGISFLVQCGLSHHFPHQVMREDNSPEFLLHQFGYLAAQRNPAFTQNRFPLLDGDLDFPSLGIECGKFRRRCHRRIKYGGDELIDFPFVFGKSGIRESIFDHPHNHWLAAFFSLLFG